jgi:hypothetical protein
MPSLISARQIAGIDAIEAARAVSAGRASGLPKFADGD